MCIRDRFIPGCRVLIPFGNRNLIGLIVKISQSTDFDLKKLKPIKALIDKEPLVSKILFDFFIWSANYYHHPIGEALLKVFPGNLRKGLPLPKTTTRCWKIDKSYSSDNTKSVKQLDLLRLLNSVDHKTDEFLKACFGRSTISALAKKGLITEFQKSYTKEKVSFPFHIAYRWDDDKIIEWKGWVQDIEKILKDTDILCLPSYREGLPKALIEGAACGLPIVTTDTVGCRDVVEDGVNGFLVPIKNIDQLAKKIFEIYF